MNLHEKVLFKESFPFMTFVFFMVQNPFSGLTVRSVVRRQFGIGGCSGKMYRTGCRGGGERNLTPDRAFRRRSLGPGC